MGDFEKLQRERVLKSIEREKRLSEENLCRWCEKNKATTYDQMYSPICQPCSDEYENRNNNE